ncbi:MAG: RNP-1 like protein RNA-binding protein [Candidatus Woesebacteria bacterium GW2011_GWB1_39_10]|uniref:RNP-1 like protein RNA-binding protein n=2 Tax=Candidatus Woeseibacteriota TaxID=1752722 RepID=A0A0G0XWP1_9BACT|nr:MAG: RNP-1 like protein RNA-binding protein [Candidatus Woesebacteria bacterium GW2011_GWB1_39_10]KKR92312.1 MAG: RNP-1 like protein RNA-binding protein [Candidatus Woesebacteria bacterium GW2011_GWA1_41_13b]
MKKLFVAGIPFTITQEELATLFSQAGVVISATIIIDKFTGKSKGFGFVEMETEEEASKAIQILNDTDFGGRKLVVAEARPQEKREFEPRGGGDRRGGYSRGGKSGGGHGSRDGRGGGYN